MPNTLTGQLQRKADLHLARQKPGGGGNAHAAHNAGHAGDAQKANAAGGSALARAEKEVQEIGLAFNPIGLWELFGQIDLMRDMPYWAMLGAAVLKDLLDIVDFETVAIPIVLSVCYGIFVIMMLVIAGGSVGKRQQAKQKARQAEYFIKRGLAILGATIGDSIPVVDLIPFETLVALYMYFLVLVERKDEQRQLEQERKASVHQSRQQSYAQGPDTQETDARKAA